MEQGLTPGNGPEHPQKVNIATTGKQGPMPEGSALLRCPACERPILAGQFYTLFPIGCGGETENRRRARRGFPYSMVFLAVHWACVTGDDSESRLAV